MPNRINAWSESGRTLKELKINAKWFLCRESGKWQDKSLAWFQS